MGLATYRKKRDFAVTAEPSGDKKSARKKKRGPRFVIQKHDASRLHYDFRLEMEGVLKSWAVPKGLPWTQAEKHLAVEVEDHPMDYADFEGVIPQGQYGGGTVMVWDRGTYEVTEAEGTLDGLRNGKFHVILHGAKVQGEWALIRMRPQGGKNQWLLMKTGGSIKSLSQKRDDESVKTGRSMKQIASDRDAEWQSNRKEDETPTSKFKARIRAALKKKDENKTSVIPSDARRSRGSARLNKPLTQRDSSTSLRSPHDDQLRYLPKANARFIEPMKPRLTDEPPTVGDWLYELKFDGIRALAIKKGTRIQLISRNEKELKNRFPEIAEACAGLHAEECVVDGEVVAMDEEGRSSFQLLQRGELDAQDAPLCFYAFDLLQVNGRSTMELPVTTRKELLGQIVPEKSDLIRFSGELPGDVHELLAEVKRRGLEGLIGKQRDSVYEPGRRSDAWIKLKSVNEQEFVIGGYTPPGGSRKHFGALLVGYYDSVGRDSVEASKKKNIGSAGRRSAARKLLFAGKVGSGFTANSLASLYKKMRAEVRTDCPFADLPSKQNGAWVQGITPGEMRKCTWVNPKLVCQIKFAEWTRDLKLRQPVFLGLREDKDAGEVVREAM